MKLTNSAMVTVLSLAALTYLGHRGMDVTMAISGVCLSYVGARAGQKGAMVFASSRDEKSDTDEIIRSIMN